MKLFLPIFLLINSIQLIGQRNQPVLYNDKYLFGISETRIEVLENKDTVFITKSNYKNTNNSNIEEIEKMYKGTPIFKNAWLTGSTIYVDGLATKGVIAYNLLNQNIQFSPKDIQKAVLVKPDSFLIAGISFVQLGKKLKLSNAAYYETVFKNQKIGIYKEHNCSFRPKVEGQKTPYHISTDDFEGAFVKSSKIFIYENDEIVELKNNSSFYKNFGERKEEIEKYAKTNNLSLKKEKDLVEILKFYASL